MIAQSQGPPRERLTTLKNMAWNLQEQDLDQIRRFRGVAFKAGLIQVLLERLVENPTAEQLEMFAVSAATLLAELVDIGRAGEHDEEQDRFSHKKLMDAVEALERGL